MAAAFRIALICLTPLLSGSALAQETPLGQIFTESLGKVRQDAQTSNSYISNGNKAKECAFPPLLRLRVGNGFCTGTLVHPRVIMYAAHCGKLSAARLGDAAQGASLSSFVKNEVNPRFDVNNLIGPNGEAIDWAFAVLSEPVKGLPVIPLAAGWEIAQLTSGDATIAMAGYGHQSESIGPGSQLVWNNNKLGETSFSILQSGLDTVNACPGDSGGPLLARRPDGSWRVIGIASTLWGEHSDAKKNCGLKGSFNHYARINADTIAWVEKQSGIDVTPCYKPDGSIEKSPECKGFYAGDPASPSGQWSDNCASSKVVNDPDLEEKPDDTEAPTVNITWPSNASKLGLDWDINIHVKAKDNQKVGKVSLVINGSVIETKTAPPFVFSWKPPEVSPAGQPYLVKATARDAVGNEAKAVTYEFSVVKNAGPQPQEPEPEPEPEPETTGGEEKESSSTSESDSQEPTPETPDPSNDETTDPSPETSGEPSQESSEASPTPEDSKKSDPKSSSVSPGQNSTAPSSAGGCSSSSRPRHWGWSLSIFLVFWMRRKKTSRL